MVAVGYLTLSCGEKELGSIKQVTYTYLVHEVCKEGDSSLMIHLVYYAIIIKENTVCIETIADMNTANHQDRNNSTILSAKLSLANSSNLSSEFGLLSAITPGDDESRNQNFLTDGVD